MNLDTFKRDRIILLGGLVIVTGLSWVYMLHLAWGMDDLANGHANATLPSGQVWSTWEFATAAAMWSMMMLAMMLPVVSPWLLAFGEITRERDSRSTPFSKVSVFLFGYGTVWLAYSLVMASSQLLLQRIALFSHGWMTASPILASAILISAGIYQWTPLRDACMSQCRSPFGFFLSNWREGTWGAYTMGVRHGMYCVGCCWALMALAFVFGVMNLLWMALVIAFLLVERATLTGSWLSKSAGALLVAWGIWILVIAL